MDHRLFDDSFEGVDDGRMQDVKEVAGVDDRCRARHDHGFFVRGGRDGLYQIYNALAHEPQLVRPKRDAAGRRGVQLFCHEDEL